jgi:hypothetical protein
VLRTAVRLTYEALGFFKTMHYELENHHRNVPDEELIAELKRVAELLNRGSVTIDQFNEHAKFNSSTLARRFGSWFKALEAAGLKWTRNLNLTKEHSLFSAGTYENRFGSWRKGLEAFVLWANEGIAPPFEQTTVTPTKKQRSPRNINWRLRALVLMRDGARCQLCGAEARNGALLHVDHIFPWSKGGETTLENLRVLCNVCNIGKSDVEPSTVA